MYIERLSYSYTMLVILRSQLRMRNDQQQQRRKQPVLCCCCQRRFVVVVLQLLLVLNLLLQQQQQQQLQQPISSSRSSFFITAFTTTITTTVPSHHHHHHHYATPFASSSSSSSVSSRGRHSQPAIPSTTTFSSSSSDSSENDRNNDDESSVTPNGGATTTTTTTISDPPSPQGTTTTTQLIINTMDEMAEQTFLAKCKVLCQERNIPFMKIKNARDLASAQSSLPATTTNSIPSTTPATTKIIQPNRIYRMGRIGDATTSDIQLLFDSYQIQTLVDLRSPTELKDDPSLMRPEVFDHCTNFVWQERRFTATNNNNRRDCVRMLPPNVGPVVYKINHNNHLDNNTTSATTYTNNNKFWQRMGGANTGTTSTGTSSTSDGTNVQPPIQPRPLPDNGDIVMATYDNADDDDNVLLPEPGDDEECGMDDNDCIEMMEEEETSVAAVQLATSTTTIRTKPNKERYFVSLMNEFKYVKGTVSKLRKRDLTAAILKSPGAMFSRRIRSNLKQPFLKEINDGGLPMLNELLFKFGAPGIRYVLQLCSDRNNHPIAFYCTAGKDRTGAIAAIILSLCHTSIDDIVEDYTLSANVYAEMQDHQAMVGALSQRNLDPKTFLGAPPTVMRSTLEFLTNEYGSVEDYCTAIGFDKEQQQQLIQACTEP